MPSHNTFSIAPISKFVGKYLSLSKRSIDPFARDFQGATITNDMNPETLAEYHEKALDFLQRFVDSEPFDLVIFDPPYSLGQVKEMYSNMGIEKLSMKEAQNTGRWSPEKDTIDKILRPGGIVLHFGWHTNGMGKKRNYEIVEILLVAHGSAHNDTICMAERKLKGLF
ncbi:MAG TPA: adenine-specific DNA methylase [bacterium]|nr:adenine-specific DNA methylase [bacterium]